MLLNSLVELIRLPKLNFSYDIEYMGHI